MSRRFLIMAVTLMLVSSIGFPLPASAQNTQVDICHLDGDTGLLAPISISESGVAKHLAHGDVLVGDGVDENCDPLPPATGLDAIRDRGFVRCGVSGFAPGFSLLTEADEYEGMDADLCRVLATAVLGDTSAVEFVQLTGADRFPALQDGLVDVLIRTTTHTLGRDSLLGVNFGPTYFYDGQGFIVRADSGIEAVPDLAGKIVCVAANTTNADRVDELAAEIDFDVRKEDGGFAAFEAFLAGECDSFSTDKTALAGLRTVAPVPDDLIILSETISKEPLAPVVAEGDDEWQEVVKWAVHATLHAEELAVTSDNVAAYRIANPDSPAFGTGDAAATLADGLSLDIDWAYRIIRDVGNYGEIYDRNLGPASSVPIPRGLNQIWTNGGLHYSPPFR